MTGLGVAFVLDACPQIVLDFKIVLYSYLLLLIVTQSALQGLQ